MKIGYKVQVASEKKKVYKLITFFLIMSTLSELVRYFYGEMNIYCSTASGQNKTSRPVNICGKIYDLKRYKKASKEIYEA